MFKANDMVVDITMGIVFLIGAFYGFLMFFDPSFTMTRYSTGAEYDEGTITIFTIWLGMFNLGFIAGIMYMGYRGLDRAFFAYAVPLFILNLIWQIPIAQDSGNYVGIVMVSVSLAALLIARSRSGFGNPFSIPKADQMWGVSDNPTKVFLWLGLIGQSLNSIIFAVDPGNLINNTEFLVMSERAQHFSLIMPFLSVAWVITLLYQLRAGLSMTMVVVGTVISTIWFVLAINYLIASGGTGGGNPLLAGTITLNFIGTWVIFLRNQANF